MPKPLSSLATWGLAAAAAGALLVGCSSEEAKLPKDKVANTVAEKLAAQTGQPKPDVTCPKDLAGKVGTTMRCKLTASDGSSVVPGEENWLSPGMRTSMTSSAPSAGLPAASAYVPSWLV